MDRNNGNSILQNKQRLISPSKDHRYQLPENPVSCHPIRAAYLTFCDPQHGAFSDGAFPVLAVHDEGCAISRSEQVYLHSGLLEPIVPPGLEAQRTESLIR